MKFQQFAGFVAAGCLLVSPAAVSAQQGTGTIAGVVKDASGAVMPGVTIEAASPALIERVRSVVSDEQGQYKTVTVSGQAPVVDTQDVQQQTTIARGTLDAIPTTKRLGQYVTIIAGATYANPTLQDVGGTAGEGGSFGIHGGRSDDLVINRYHASRNSFCFVLASRVLRALSCELDGGEQR
jgi:hypothetical protein